MRIGIDARVILRSHAGVSRYVSNLIRNLALIDRQNRYLLFFDLEGFAAVGQDNFRQRVIRISPCLGKGSLRQKIESVLWVNFLLPYALLKEKVEVLHSPNSVSPLLTRPGCKTVITVNDMLPFVFPQLHPGTYSNFIRMSLPPAMAKADKIITYSQAVKKDIQNICHIPEEKIEVIYLGLEPRHKIITDLDRIEAVKCKYGLPDRFVLFIGTLEPRKNVTRLIIAFSKSKEIRATHKLVLAGQEGWLSESIFETVRNSGLAGDVIFTGYIQEDDLPSLYNAADLFVFPTLYEGFGLPLLEAMACGIPIVASNTSSIPEIVGDAALLVDPYSVEDIARGMERALLDSNLRAMLVQKGLERVKQFSWQTTSEKTLKVYQQVAGQGQS